MSAHDQPRAGRWLAIIVLALLAIAAAIAIYGLIGPAPRSADGAGAAAPNSEGASIPRHGP